MSKRQVKKVDLKPNNNISKRKNRIHKMTQANASFV
jgi:hypothetical protein